MTPSQKLRSIADSTGLDGIADAIREIAEEIEHNNATAVPQGLPAFDDLDDDVIDAACTAGSLLYRVDLMRAYECIRKALAATPAPAPAQEPAKETFQSRHEREFMERMAGNHGKLTEFCAALESFTHDYQRLYSTYKSYRDMISDLIKERDSLRDQVAKPAQEVGLTDELEQLGHIANGIRICGVHDKRFVAQRIDDIIAALRAKGGK